MTNERKKSLARAAVLYSKGIKEYDRSHILKGDQFDHFLCLLHKKLGKHAQLEIVEPPSAGYQDLTLIH